MNTSNIYYVLINSDNLAHYLSKSCICPVKYINNRNDDIQSIVTEKILLSKKNWSEITNCTIEIAINDEEKIHRVNDSIFLYDLFIPTSKIKNIYFDNQAQLETTVWNINETSSFLPSNLVKLITESEKEILKKVELNELPQIDVSKNISNYLNNFDSILGSINMMKLFSNITIENKSITNLNFLSLISYFNTEIKIQLERYKKLNSKYWDLYEESNSIFWNDIKPVI
jgi:hypothetical protein